MTTPAALRTRGLTFRYGAEVAVHGLDLELLPGEIHGLVGPNGAGKTTTIRLILGLLPPASGDIEVLGRPLRSDRARILREVGALVETPALYAHLTGEENLLLEARVRGVPRAAVRNALERAGLASAATKKVRAYSLGMRQRLALALALLHAPRLLVLDEPANGLDPEGIAELRAQLASLAAEGLALLVSSHLLGELEQVATRVAVLRKGTLAFQGPLDGLRRLAGCRLQVGCAAPEEAASRLASEGLAAERRNGHLLVAPPAGAGWSEAQVARVNALLVQAGVPVHRLELEAASLEGAYMALVAEGVEGGIRP